MSSLCRERSRFSTNQHYYVGERPVNFIFRFEKYYFTYKL